MALSFVAQSARGLGPAAGARSARSTRRGTIAERFLIRWRGEAEPRPRQGDRRLLDLGGRARHERLDLHRARRRLDRRRRRRGALRRGRRPERPAARRRALARAEDARRGRAARATPSARSRTRSTAASASWASATASTAPRTRARACCAGPRSELGSPRFEVAEALEQAALAELQGAQARPRAGHERRVLVGRRARHRRGAGGRCSRRMFTCARVAGWSAHILEQKREGAADPPDREVRRARAAAAGRGARQSSARCRMSRRARWSAVGEAGERRRRGVVEALGQARAHARRRAR